MYIHQNGKYFPYDVSSIDEEHSNPWHDSIQRIENGQNESTPEFNGNTTSCSLHSENREEVFSGLPFVQISKNLWESDPLHETLSSDEFLEDESKNIWQSQIPEEKTATTKEFNISNIEKSTVQSILLGQNNDPNSIIFEKQESGERFATINGQPIIVNGKSSSDHTLKNTLQNNSLVPFNTTQSLEDDAKNKLNEQESSLQEKPILTNIVNSSDSSSIITIEDIHNPSNELSLEIPVTESKVLELQINPIHEISEYNSNEFQINLSSTSSSLQPILQSSSSNLKYSNVDLDQNELKPAKNIIENLPTLQLGSSKIEDVIVKLNQNDLKSVKQLEEKSEEIGKLNDIDLLSKQPQSLVAFHAYKQIYSKWIQKLIIIPGQHHGCHNITAVVTIF